MFDFLKKPKFEIISPANGKLKSITEVCDEAFSSKALGDGFVIEPKDGEVYSPVDGVVEMIFPTLHAIVLKCSNGIEILVHIGVDTVELNGEGFKTFVTKREEVKAGELLLKFDIDSIKDKVPSTDIIIIFTSGETLEINKKGQEVTIGEDNIVGIKSKFRINFKGIKSKFKGVKQIDILLKYFSGEEK